MNFEKKIATRDGFGEEIVALGKENRNILVVDADIGKSCKTGAFRKALPEQYREVLQLAYFDGFSPSEISGVMRKTSKQVYNLLARAKTALKELLEKEGITHEDLR